ncbi:MAG: ArnT family glycosyltransferase [Candidatus Acidiferrales bacterium]
MKSLLKRTFSSPVFITTVAFLFRIGVMMHSDRIVHNPVHDNLPFGYELGAVARSIAAGEGFSSPLRWFRSGPTAWFGPVYPYLVAGVFKLFGIYSYTSYVVLQALNCAFTALTCIPIYLAGKRSFGTGVALCASWLWVFLPTALFFPIIWIWDTSLSALWMALLLYATLKLRDSARTIDWIGYGALWAGGAMINPALVAVLPALGIWLVLGYRKRALPWLRVAAVGSLVFLAGISPWTIRNYVVFHKLIPFRSNLGLELWLGNNAETVDNDSWDQHPNDDLNEGLKYKQLGEIQYMQQKQHEAFAYMRAHPAHDALLTFHRFISTWLGIWDPVQDFWASLSPLMRLAEVTTVLYPLFTLLGALFASRSRNPEIFPYLAVILFFPLVFYLTHASLRYRFPMDPVMIVLASNGILSVLAPITGRWRGLRAPALHSRPTP